MKLITITQPAFFEGEAEAITSLFEAGLEILHLRKPGASYEDMEQLLNRLFPKFERHSSERTQPDSTGRLHRTHQPFLPFAGRSHQIQSNMRLRISQSHIRQHFQRRIFLCLYYRQLAKGAAGGHYRR